MACVWNSPYIFLDKNKQSYHYTCMKQTTTSSFKTFCCFSVCPPGTYHNSSGGLSSSFCVPCPRGWYQPHAGASVCKPCSKNNVSNKLNHTSRPAVSITNCPPVDNPTDASNSKMEKGYFINFLCNLPYCF